MTDFWWRCKTCGADLFHSPAVLLHRRETGHNGAALMSEDCPPPGRSSADVRRAALAAAREAVDAAKRKRNAEYGEAS